MLLNPPLQLKLLTVLRLGLWLLPPQLAVFIIASCGCKKLDQCMNPAVPKVPIPAEAETLGNPRVTRCHLKTI